MHFYICPYVGAAGKLLRIDINKSPRYCLYCKKKDTFFQNVLFLKETIRVHRKGLYHVMP
jgi:hypothetical protein